MCPQHCHLSPSHSSHPLSAFFSPPSSENLQPRTAIPNRCPDETRRKSPPRRPPSLSSRRRKNARYWNIQQAGRLIMQETSSWLVVFRERTMKSVRRSVWDMRDGSRHENAQTHKYRAAQEQIELKTTIKQKHVQSLLCYGWLLDHVLYNTLLFMHP